MTDARRARISSRPYRGDDDYRAIRELLLRTVSGMPLGFNWDVRRWDGWRYYRVDERQDPAWSERVRIWEVESRLVAAVHPEGSGDAHLEIDPRHRDLEDEMFAWAESRLSVAIAGGARTLSTYVHDDDTLRRDTLARRGYRPTDFRGCVRRLRVTGELLEPPRLPEGYALRTTRPTIEDDFPDIADLLNAVFDRDCHSAAELRVFTAHAPCFDPELDLVAVSPDGELAAYVGVAYDDTNHRGIFEPVGTRPEYRGRGLARALMIEGLRRLAKRHAHDATVGTGDADPANRLYETMGFREVRRGRTWRRTLGAP